MKPQQRRSRKAARRAQRLASRSDRAAHREARRSAEHELPNIAIVNLVDEVTGDIVEHVLMLHVRRSSDHASLTERLRAAGAEVDADSWCPLTVACPTTAVLVDAMAIARAYWREEVA